MGGAVGAVVLIPAIGMGMSFPLLTDLVARVAARPAAPTSGAAYALNTVGSIAGRDAHRLRLRGDLARHRATLRVGLAINGSRR